MRTKTQGSGFLSQGVVVADEVGVEFKVDDGIGGGGVAGGWKLGILAGASRSIEPGIRLLTGGMRLPKAKGTVFGATGCVNGVDDAGVMETGGAGRVIPTNGFLPEPDERAEVLILAAS